MAQDKKSFLLYCDLVHTVRKLDKATAGELFLHILEYVNDQDPVTDNPIVDITFEHIKQALKRDLEKYERIRQRNRQNGQKGGRPKKPIGLSGNPTKPKKADSVNDSDIVNDSDNDILLEKETKAIDEFNLFWMMYDKKVGPKDRIQKKFVTLSQSKRDAIFEHFPKYVAATEKQYRKNPMTYLNQESWNDEIIQASNATASKYPDHFDSAFARNLNASQLQEYQSHLRSLGWQWNHKRGQWVSPQSQTT